MKLNERYFVKIVPQRGETVHRFEVHRRHIIAVSLLLGLLVFGSILTGVIQIERAHARVQALQSLAGKQRTALHSIEKKTAAIRKQLQHVQKQNTEIQQLIGVRPAVRKTVQVRHSIAALAEATEQTEQESNRLRRLTMHVLNVRHVQELARASALAAIPSIDPVNGAEIVGCFCYRTYPDVEFHEGVDLGADYGDVVHAAAAGTIISAGWEGGYGEKIDIDHGNGYHTWYAHLSRIDVSAGQYVHKGQEIGLVGSTGFSTGPHLHYQIMLNGVAVNPTPYLHGVPTQVLASLP